MLENKKIKIRFEFMCEAEYDYADPENPVLVKSARDVVDETLATLNNFGAAQTPPARVLSQQRDLNSDNIILSVSMDAAVASLGEASAYYTALENNVDSLPDIVEDSLLYVFSAK